MARTVERMEVRVGGNIAGATNALQRLGDRVDRAGQRMQRAGRRMSTAITLPLAAIAGAATRAGMAFDDEFSRIRGLVGLAESDVAALRAEVLRLAPAVGRGPQELAEALFTVTSAGARGRTAMEVLQASAMAATAGLGETETVARAVTAVLATYSAEGLTAAEVTDTLTAAIRAGNLEADTMAGVLGQVVGSAQAAGAQFTDVAAAIAVMSRQGIDAARAANSLNGLFEVLVRNSPQVSAALAEVGLSTEGLRRQMGEEGLLSVLQTLDRAFDGNTEAMARAIPNSQAFRAVLSILGQDADTVAEIFGNVRNSTGTLQEAFDAAQTPGQRMRQAMVQLQTAGIALGDQILPTVARAVGSLGNMIQAAAEAWQRLDGGTQRAALALAAAAAAMGPLLTVTGFLVSAIGASLVGAVLRLAAALGFIVSPIGLVVAALAAAGVAAFLFRDEIRTAFESARAAVADRLQALQETLSRWRDQARDLWQSAARGLRSLFVDPVVNLLGDLSAFLGRWATRARELMGPFARWMGFDLGRAADDGAEQTEGALARIQAAMRDAFTRDGAASVNSILLPLNTMQRSLDAAGNATSEIGRRARREFNAARQAFERFAGTVGEMPEFDMDGFLDAGELIGDADEVGEAGEQAAGVVATAFEGAGDSISRAIGNSVAHSSSLLEGLANVARNVVANIATGLASAGLSSMLGGMSIPGFASGGRMQRGFNWVGERGAELVYSDGPATVRNAAAASHDARSNGGGMNLTINAPGADAGTLARLTQIVEARVIPQAVQSAKASTLSTLGRRSFS